MRLSELKTGEKGVVVKGVTLDAANPAADAFKQGAGEIGYRFAGLVLLCADLF